jgi:hypothetical protein
MTRARILYRTVDCGNPLPPVAIAPTRRCLPRVLRLRLPPGEEAGLRKARA